MGCPATPPAAKLKKGQSQLDIVAQFQSNHCFDHYDLYLKSLVILLTSTKTGIEGTKTLDSANS